MTRVVVYEETGEERKVLRDCKVCVSALGEELGTGVVSASGLVHVTEYEKTLCGKDATGDNWWWPL